VSCAKCDELAEDDIDFEPNCEICIDVRGFTELLPANEFIMQLYYDMNSQFVYDHKLEESVLNEYKEEIESYGGTLEVIRMLSVITQTSRKIKDGQKAVDSKD
jgi:hypothetical protein